MERFGIKTGLDLRAQTLDFLQQHFGKAGPYYYWVSRGVDERPVRADRTRKSVGAENTFPADLFTYEAARDALREIVDKVWGHCEISGIRGRTVTLKVKFGNFQQITRSRTGQMQIKTRSELEQLGNDLLRPLFPVARGVRLLGVSLSSLGAKEAEREPEFSLPFRDLRRGGLTETADAGATLVQLHATSGHKSMQSSEPYLVPTMDQADEAIRKREKMRARRKRNEN
jgi:DNA polymerase-4